MENISITKFNPAFRDNKGIYQKSEWTSYSDIGKVFDDGLLKRTEYEKIEKQYLDVVFSILSYFNSKRIKIEHLFKLSPKSDFVKNNDIELYETYQTLKKGTIIRDEETISKVLKLRLREYIAELELSVDSKSKSEILFGFDYYMYLKTNKDVQPLLNKINEIGLYAG